MKALFAAAAMAAVLGAAGWSDGAERPPATSTVAVLKVGVATVDITPAGPAWMAGYSARKAPSTGVFKNLSAACVVFDNGATRAGIMALDVCYIGTQQLAGIRAAAEKLGIPPNQMMVNSSHTHCGPSFSSKNADYLNLFAANTSNLVEAAVADLKDATLDYTVGQSLVGLNRRQAGRDGKVAGIAPEPRKRIDADVPILRVLGGSNEVRAVMFGYACHPVTMGGQEISPDYPGPAREWIAAAFTNSQPVFLQGFGGDVRPRIALANGKFGYVLVDGKQMLTELGHELGRDVVSAVCVPPPPVTAPPNRPFPLAGASEKLALPGKKDPKQTREIELAVLRIGDVYMVFGQGEMCSEIGMRIKSELADWCKRTQSRVWTCAYSHWGGGYIPHAAAYAEGGYEVTSSGVGPGAEALIVRRAVAMVKALQGRK
jgi:neutral ceramidase